MGRASLRAMAKVSIRPQRLFPENGGAERDRTADLLIANEALSQLSYGPGMRVLRGRQALLSRERVSALDGWT